MNLIKAKKCAAPLLALAVAVAVSLAACVGQSSPEASPPPEDRRVFTDSAGREVELPVNITRIAPSGALAQMFLIAVAPDMLVSKASEYSEEDRKYIPDAVADLPVIGQFYGSDNLNLETIASINPDVVIDVGEPKGTIVEDMDGITQVTAIPAIHITADLRSAPQAFRALGELLGREESGEALAAFCERALALTDDIMARVGDDKVSALYCLGDAGLNVLARTSFHSEVLDYLTDNLAVVDGPSSKGSGNETDLEQISVWDPDVIIFAPDSVYDDVAGDPTWSELRAVSGGSFYKTPSGPYNWMGSPPSINRYAGMLWLASALYPEYAEFELYDEIREYYSLFYGFELSRDEFDALLSA
ncbi:MAG: ABC transporter substrate-binding protein [Oscillospiraceae bacterium]|jgi:iron complex transport system substrate-binding protein|nr:ABC transporter substrate-binding protein [Oscillospiraceae bacterium]